MALNGGYVYRHVVDSVSNGRELVDYHAARFHQFDREGWRAHAQAGRLRINGVPVREGRRVATGDAIEYHREPWDEPDVDVAFQVVFEDEHVLVVDKPSGLQVLPAGPFFEHTLLRQVRASDASRADASPVHRLGRGTSGLVLLGKSALARSVLSRQFRDFEPRKTYVAQVDAAEFDERRFGPGRDGTIARFPLERVPHGPLWIHVASTRGKASTTRVRVLRRAEGGTPWLVAAQPITGRPDQIRVHLAALGMPIAGDPLFGPGGKAISDAPPGLGGYRLHAAALAFPHPLHGRWVKARRLPAWVQPIGAPCRDGV